MTTENYEIGTTVSGRVCEIRPYGAIVDLEGGRQGLLHISEISPKFVRNIADFAPIGANLRFLIIDEDPKSHFLRLSLKRLKSNTNNQPEVKKRRIVIDPAEIDFTPLAAQMPDWIKKAAEKVSSQKKDKKKHD